MKGRNVEAIFEGERDGGRDSECNGGGDVESNRVEAVRLAADSQ